MSHILENFRFSVFQTSRIFDASAEKYKSLKGEKVDEPLAVLTFPEERRTSKRKLVFQWSLLHLDAKDNMVVGYNVNCHLAKSHCLLAEIKV